mmetsp:Transcript_30363/g.63460  ORF Transcript_30363/g.63460 Transcript_30363/m.63460 type:complete len:1137 (+) Transcript_30363:166-3576(+)
MKEDEFNESEEDKLLDPIAKSILRDLRAEMKEDDSNESEVDEFLDPIAQSILRDLQAEVDEAASSPGHIVKQRLFDPVILEHPFTVVKDTASGVISVIMDTGDVIKCDEQDLLPNEIIHCNMALEQNGDDADGEQGGQLWKSSAPTMSPVLPRYDADGNYDPNGIHDEDGNVARYDDDGNLDPDGAFDARGDSITYDVDGTATERGEYDSDGALLLFDEYGNLDPNGTYTLRGGRVTDSPTMYPTVGEVPTYRPTVRADPWELRGTIYYDHNANGVRDSNLLTTDFGQDPEHQYGLGGVTIQMVECDPETNERLDTGTEEEEDNTYANTVSRGFDPFLHARIVEKKEGGGEYTLINIKIDRAYYIQAKAPEGYILSGGVCNDDEPDKEWHCSYGKGVFDKEDAAKENQATIQDDGGGNGRSLRRRRQQRRQQRQRGLTVAALDGYVEADPKELKLGIREGRSTRCIPIDRMGNPDISLKSSLDLGVMRIGDTLFEETEVELGMDLLEGLDSGGRRRLERALQEFQSDVVTDGVEKFVVLGGKDGEAIQSVTAEVLAAQLDKTLGTKGAVLESVVPIDVRVYLGDTPEASNNSSATDADAPTREEAAASRLPRIRDGGKLTVSVKVNGHYNKNNKNINNFKDDFDYIVQDSINRNTGRIRKDLNSFNTRCDGQTTKVNLGAVKSDFEEIHSDRGADPTKILSERKKQQEQTVDPDLVAFSSACDNKNKLPDYFVESLDELEVKAETKPRTYVIEEEGAGPWAIVGATGAGALCILFFGFYLFHRGLKRERSESVADYYSDDYSDNYTDADSTLYSSGSSVKRGSEEDKKNEKSGMHGGGLDKTFPSTDKPKKTAYFLGMVHREVGNMTAALTGNRWRFGGKDENGADAKESTLHDPINSGVTNLESRMLTATTALQNEDLNSSILLAQLEEMQDEKMEEKIKRKSGGSSRMLSSRRLSSTGSSWDLDDGSGSDSNSNSIPGVTYVTYGSSRNLDDGSSSGDSGPHVNHVPLRRDLKLAASSSRRLSMTSIYSRSAMDLKKPIKEEDDIDDDNSSSSSSDSSSGSSSSSSSSSSDDDEAPKRPIKKKTRSRKMARKKSKGKPEKGRTRRSSQPGDDLDVARGSDSNGESDVASQKSLS